MSSEVQKAETELKVFANFLKLARLPISPESVEKRLPPEPDLLCSHDEEGEVAFELVELCDPNLARALASKRPNADGVEYIRTSDYSGTIVSKKLKRKYISPYPVELLCYTDSRIITPPDVILEILGPLLSSYRHTFTRAWLLSEGEVHRLWGEA